MVEDRITALEDRVARLEADAPGEGGGASVRAPWRSAERAGDAPADHAGRPWGAQTAPERPRGASTPPPRSSTPLGAAPAGAPASRHAAAPPSMPAAAASSPAGAAPASRRTPAWAHGTASHARVAAPAPYGVVAPPKPIPQRAPRDLEDFVGGSVLAWLGGVAVLAGLAFLLTIAISSGWIGEGARTALAGVLSAGLFAAGVWLRERKAQTEASLAAAAVGVAGLFGTLVVAGPVYHLVPVPLAFAGAFATGAAATALAIRWRAQVMGWLGLLGALWAPTALGAFDGGGMAFLAIAFAATIPVLVHQRWTTLGVFAYLTMTLQWRDLRRVSRTPRRPR